MTSRTPAPPRTDAARAAGRASTRACGPAASRCGATRAGGAGVRVRRPRARWLAVVAVAVAGVPAARSLDVDHVDVAGTVRPPRPRSARRPGIRPGATMVDLDTGSVARRVEARPWVARATVERQLAVDGRGAGHRAHARWPRRAPDRVGRLLDRTGRVVLGSARTAQPGWSRWTGSPPGAGLVGRRPRPRSTSPRRSAPASAPRRGRVTRGSDGLDLRCAAASSSASGRSTSSMTSSWRSTPSSRRPCPIRRRHDRRAGAVQSGPDPPGGPSLTEERAVRKRLDLHQELYITLDRRLEGTGGSHERPGRLIRMRQTALMLGGAPNHGR